MRGYRRYFIIIVMFLGIAESTSYGDSDTGQSQSPKMLTWAKTYGGKNVDSANSVQQTTDGGYIVAGSTYSFGAGKSDIWVFKLDGSGNLLWNKTYGENKWNSATTIQQTIDGGYIVAGSMVLKLNSKGDVIWQKSYDGNANSVQQTTDGGYIVAGFTSSFGAGKSDVWILKLGADGNVIWQKAYGGINYDYAYSIQQTSDGGYIAAGKTFSFGAGDSDLWVSKLDRSGNAVWQKAYGGKKEDYASSIQQTTDGGYVVAGCTFSFGAGDSDLWVLKLDRSGNAVWQKAYGGIKKDCTLSIHQIQQTTDGGYVVVSDTNSFNQDPSGFDRPLFWVLKLNMSGEVLWEKIYCCTGIGDASYFISIQQTKDGGYIMASETYILPNGTKALILKLNADGEIPGYLGRGKSKAIVNNTKIRGINSSVRGVDISGKDFTETIGR